MCHDDDCSLLHDSSKKHIDPAQTQKKVPSRSECLFGLPFIWLVSDTVSFQQSFMEHLQTMLEDEGKDDILEDGGEDGSISFSIKVRMIVPMNESNRRNLVQSS